ncbi:MAG: hypothetical protein U1F98_13040 [Verrucomicrobiota bacterium]
MSTTNSFQVTVNEINSAPVLPLQTNHTVAELTLLVVTNTATDSDVPANALSYQLVNPPSGCSHRHQRRDHLDPGPKHRVRKLHADHDDRHDADGVLA